MPEISIVMPTFDQSKFIKEAIDSILCQSFKDWELIIVNDGYLPKDSQVYQDCILTDRIIREYGDPRIDNIRKEHGGIGDSLNVGFSFASGKYETWFASDNKLYPNALKELRACLETHPDIDLVYANYEIGIMDYTGLKEVARRNVKKELRSQEWDPEYFRQRNQVGIIWLWRRELREKCGAFQLEPCEDYDMLLRMVEADGRFAFLDKCLGWFRRHDGNMTKKMALPYRFSEFVQEKARARRMI